MKLDQGELFAITEVAEESVSVAEVARVAPAPVVSAATEESNAFEGWTNSATYLADLHLANNQAAANKVRALISPDCRLDGNQLAKVFTVRRSNDDEEVMSGVFGDRLVLDAWAEGEIDWFAIAAHWAALAREDLGATKIADAVVHVLANLEIDGLIARLTSGQLDRKLYQQVDAVLQALGGKWDRRQKGHVFESDPSEILEGVMLTGRYTKPENFGFFPTPAALADRVIELADLRPGMLTLEPSAGTGALLSRAAAIVGGACAIGVELQEKLYLQLGHDGYCVYHGDFLSRAWWHSPDGFERIVANPPFTRQADLDHVMHAWSMLRPGGRLVSIMSASLMFRENRTSVAFREFIDSFGTWYANEEGAFKESGTSVRTGTVVLDKPA